MVRDIYIYILSTYTLRNFKIGNSKEKPLEGTMDYLYWKAIFEIGGLIIILYLMTLDTDTKVLLLWELE